MLYSVVESSNTKPRMSSLLLVGDLNRDLYHVGDEASFNEVSRRIERALPVLSLVPFNEPLPSADESLGVLKRMMQGDEVPAGLRRLLDPHGGVWFVGSGNMTSLFRQHFYHRLTIIRAAWNLGKLVIATSQTLGPFSEEDAELFAIHANLGSYWSVRDREWSGRQLTMAGASWEQVPDDAVDLEFARVTPEPAYNVGLSLRDWDSPRVATVVRWIVEALGPETRLHLIPHIVSSGDQYDLSRMRQHFAGIDYGNDFLRASGGRFDIQVKSVTAAMDLVIATRYHAAVFATSASVRCIALYENEYYERKMKGLESWGHPHLLVRDVALPPTTEQLQRFRDTRPQRVPLVLAEPSAILERAASKSRL